MDNEVRDRGDTCAPVPSLSVATVGGALDKRDVVAVLTTLYRGGHALDAQAIYTWALANGWPGRGAERPREMAEKIGSGHRMQSYTRDNPLRPDALTRWRDNGSVQ